MHRILVALLSAFDALVAAFVGIVVALAPLTLLWAFSFGDAADWTLLWSAAARIWQLGNLVPLRVDLGESAAVLGIPDDGAAFALSLAPLAFAGFAFFFAARSGRRSVRSGAGTTGVVSGVVVTVAVATTVMLTSRGGVVEADGWPAVLGPALVYAAGLCAGASLEGWSAGEGGLVDRVRARVDDAPAKWREVPSLAVRGASLAVTAVVGAAALAVLAAVVLRADEAVALFERAQLDGLDAAAVALAQLAYVPTIVGWAVAWIAGPGFAVGTASAVSPAGTQLGAVPGIPLLGLLPEQGSGWLLLVLLIPIAAGALAAWHVRTLLVEEWAADPPEPAEFADEAPREPVSPRLVLALAIAVLSGAAAAAIAALSSGSMGPGRFADVGADPGAVALAVGLEVLVGAAIVLLAPRGRHEDARAAADDDARDGRGLHASVD